MIPLPITYKGIYLGTSEDLAHHQLNAYKVNDEIHLVYESGYAVSEKIDVIFEDMDKYMWTPYIEFINGAKNA